MNELPEGWASCSVGEYFRSFSGGTPDRGESSYWGGNVPWLSSGDIKSDRIRESSESITRDGLDNSSAKLARPGSVVVVVRSGILKHTLPVAVLEREASINQDLKCFDSASNELNHWLALALRASENSILTLNREGTTVQSVKYDTLKNFELFVPPFAEQRRIVEKVEALLVKVRASQERLDKIPRLLKRFRRGVLTAACTGRLTADWRAGADIEETAAEFVNRIREERSLRCSTAARTVKPNLKAKSSQYDFDLPVGDDLVQLPPGWCVASIGDISDCLDRLRIPVNKTSRAARQGSIPYYGANAQVGWIDDFLFNEELVLVVEDETFIGREKPFSYVIRGKSWVNNHAHVLRPAGGMCPEYLDSCLSYYNFTPLTSGTTGRRKLNQEALLNAPLWIAPPSEQLEIVRRVKALFDFVATLEERYDRAMLHVGTLTQSILAKAFRGELVPTEAELASEEGRTYETAEELLARIKTANAAQHNGRKTSSRARRKKVNA